MMIGVVVVVEEDKEKCLTGYSGDFLTLYALALQLPSLADEVNKNCDEDGENEPAAAARHDRYELGLRQAGNIPFTVSECSQPCTPTHQHARAWLGGARAAGEARTSQVL